MFNIFDDEDNCYEASDNSITKIMFKKANVEIT